jgi:hypothetical protein
MSARLLLSTLACLLGVGLAAGQPPDNPRFRERPVKAEPSLQKRAPIGKVVAIPKQTSLLMERSAGQTTWARLAPGATVQTNEELVGLPGSVSGIDIDGIRLLLRGYLPEFASPDTPLLSLLRESRVVLGRTPGADLDLTLERGLVQLTNRKEKGPVVVRLHFGKETWKVTLDEPGAEVGISLVRRYTQDVNYREGEEPYAGLSLTVLRGKADLKVEDNTFALTAPPGPALFTWDNKAGASGPARMEKLPAFWSLDVPDTEAARKIRHAVAELAKRLEDNKELAQVLRQMRRSDEARERVLAIYCMGALDMVARVLDALHDGLPAHTLDRRAALFTLRHWIGCGTAQDRQLFDEKKKTGLLVAEKRFTLREAEAIYLLLHDFTDEMRGQPETFDLLATYLGNQQVAIAELAYWQLSRLAGAVKLPDFNAAWPREQRLRVAEEVKKLIADGKLPPARP